MKGVDVLIASVLILIISITAVFIALQLGGPSTQKTEEVILMQEGKNTLVSINNAVKNVLSEGEGSTRVLRLSISGGTYNIGRLTNSITFSMESRGQIIAEGVSKVEDGINFTGLTRMIYLNLSFDNIQLTGEGEFGRGYHTVTIRNDGYNSSTKKQMVYISTAPPAAPTLITFTSQYSQVRTINITGAASTTDQAIINTYLNTNGDGNSWNILEKKTISNVPTYYINSTENLQNTSGTTEKEALRLRWFAETNSKYLVIGYLEGNNSNINNQTLVRVRRNNAQQFYFLDRPKVANTERIPFAFMQVYNGTGTNVTYNWTFASSSTGTTGAIRARLAAIRIDNLSNSQYNYSYNATEQANVNNAWEDATGDTNEIKISPYADGFYLLWGSAVVESDSAASSVSMRMNINNGEEYIPYLIGGEPTWSYSRIEDTNTADEVGFNIFAVRKFNNSMIHSIKIQIADIDTTPSADWKYRTLIAIRLSDVFDFFNSSKVSQASTNSQSFQNYTVVNVPSGNSGNYLAIGGIAMRGDNTSYDFENRLVFDGIEKATETFRPQDTNDYVPSSYLYNFNIDDNMHYIASQYRRVGTTGNVYVKNSDILLISLDGMRTYRAEVEHNSTVSFSGTLNSISVSLNCSTSSLNSPTFNFLIYNFILGKWETCDAFNPVANTWYLRWCNKTINSQNYLPSGLVRVRLNETSHKDLAELKEDYIQYYTTYTQ